MGYNCCSESCQVKFSVKFLKNAYEDVQVTGFQLGTSLKMNFFIGIFQGF